MIDSHFHLEKLSLVTVSSIVRSQRVLQQVNIILQLSRKVDIKLGHHLFK
jgi:hypothetical protein